LAELSDLEMATAMDVLRQSPPAFMEECEWALNSGGMNIMGFTALFV